MDRSLPLDDVKAVASLWGAKLQSRLFGTNHEFYQVVIGEITAVLRLAPLHHRNFNDVMGEVTFLEYLQGKAPVVKVVRSLTNKLLMPAQIDGRQFIVCMFEMIGGSRLCKDEVHDVGVIQLWGETMGSLHSLSKQYNTCGNYYRTLNESALLNFVEILKITDPLVTSLIKDKWDQIRSWPIAQNDWGIIHGDLTMSNMHLLQNKLHVFDFDNCMHAPYLYDIAVTFYVTLLGFTDQNNRQRLAENFILNFIKGYIRRCNTIIDADLLTLLMDFYNLYIYVLLTGYELHPYKQHVLNGMQNGILTGIDLKKLIN